MKNNLEKIIEEKGYTQKFIAKKVGVSQQQLNDWIKGRAYPRIDKAFKLAEVLGVDVNNMYEKKPPHIE